MEEKKSRTKMLVSAVLFPLIAAAMLFLVFRNYDLGSVWRLAASADFCWLLPAIAAMLGFVVCESVNIARVLRASGYRVGFGQMLTYGAAGFFFSGITPTSSGGQPMQLVYMARDHIRFSHGSLSLLVELTGFQMANLSLAVFGLLYNGARIRAMSAGLRAVIAVGLGANGAVFLVLLLLIFHQKSSEGIGKLLKRVCRAMKKENLSGRIEEQLLEYRAGAVYIREHPGLILRNIATSFVQLTAICSIPYFVYRSLGGASVGWAEIFSLQAVLAASTAVIPLPGAVGAGESGFRLIFASVFPESLLMPGMLLSRGISFYLCLLLTGAYLLVNFICRKAGGSGK